MSVIIRVLALVLALAQPAAFGTSLLVFSKTSGFRHVSIPDGIEMLTEMAAAEGWSAEFTEDSAAFSAGSFARFDVVVFLNTTGDVLDDGQMASLRAHLASGKGFVGIHSATDTEHGDDWFGRLIGARFARHPNVQENVLTVHKECGHPSIAHLGPTWTHTDEWYDFRAPVASYVTPLLTTATTEYPDGESPGGGHPIAWFHEFEGGRVFYTGLGHTSEAYQAPEFVAHMREALRWAAGK